MQQLCNALLLERSLLMLTFAAKTKRYETIFLDFCYNCSDGPHELRGMGW